ncbi:hypothetical protein [Streptomyces sp. WAC06614]|uniref:hypothetical protein n=1 Tax=Streptomyces sp. WAC06614 TaxID=2487416 RepID=UPI000F77EE7A|nr:hypothetical protein [Streptomyces sp. WAC06614]RSS81853.1 hypothetical protein EF918_08980 [Streptomyces sp. WAC06614]
MTATPLDAQGKPAGESVKCGTLAQAEQKQSEDQYRAGYRYGFADLRRDCQKEPPRPRATAPDPDWQKGYDAGAADAADKFCDE